MPVLHLDEPPMRLGGVGPPRPPKSFAQVLKPERKLAKDPTWATSFKVSARPRGSTTFVSVRD